MLNSLIQIAAYLSTIIATLRAGSRVLYLQQHNGTLGVMDGPLIEFQYTNDTSVNLFDISRGFATAVKVSLVPASLIQNGSPELEMEIGQGIEKSKRISEIKHVFREMLNVQSSSWRRLTRSNYFLFEKDVNSNNTSEFYDRYGRKIHCGATRRASVTLLSPISTSQKHKKILTNVTSYASEMFSDLRYRFGIDEAEFRRVLTGETPFVSFQSNSKGAARAGGIFFFTRDGSYMIKSIKVGANS